MRELPPLAEQDAGSLTPRPAPAEARPGPLFYAAAVEDERDGEAELGGWLEYWTLLRRQRGLIQVCVLLGAVAGLLFSLPQTPTYRARATLVVEALNENYLDLRDVSPTATPAGYGIESDISTEVKVLGSRTLLEKVIRRLGLEEHPELQASRGLLAGWRDAFGLPAAPTLPPLERVLALASENTAIEPSRRTRVIEIFSEWPDPRLAADFANTLVEAYVDHNLQMRWETTQRTSEWLTRQLEDLRIKLEASAEQLQQYARQSGLMFTSEKESVAEEKLRQLQAELSKAQAERIAGQSRYELVVATPPQEWPEALARGPLREHQRQLAELRRELAVLLSSYTEDHYKVRRLQAEIEETEAALATEQADLRRRIHNDYEAARRRESLLEANYRAQARLVSEQNEQAIQYNILQGEVETNRQLYDSLLQKVKEARVASAMRANNIRVVDPALPPRRPYRPDHLFNTLAGLAAGLLVGVLLAVVLERTDRTVKQPGDLAQSVRAPELGVIPMAEQLGSPGEWTGARRTGPNPLPASRLLTVGGDEPPERGPGPSKRVELIAWEHKPTLAAEYYRATVTSILFAVRQGGPPRVLVVTSPSPGEGKTTVVSNLGICLAEIRRQVLIIDGDLRKPRFHQIFRFPNRRGLSDLLASSDPPSELASRGFIHPTTIPGLHVLPSGRPRHAISQLLHSHRTATLIQCLRERFDTVLIDTPPMMQIPDARVLGRIADAVVLVARAGQTSRGTASAAADRLRADGCHVLGTVLNSWNPKTNGYGYYDDYDRYSSYYGTRETWSEAQEKSA